MDDTKRQQIFILLCCLVLGCFLLTRDLEQGQFGCAVYYIVTLLLSARVFITSTFTHCGTNHHLSWSLSHTSLTPHLTWLHLLTSPPGCAFNSQCSDMWQELVFTWGQSQVDILSSCTSQVLAALSLCEMNCVIYTLNSDCPVFIKVGPTLREVSMEI